MNNNCLNILKWTEAQLKYTYDVSLQEATPQELHEALGQAVMMAISDDWSHSKKTRMPNRKAYYISAEYLIGRLVYSNLFNLGILDEMKELFAEHGVDLAILEDIEDRIDEDCVFYMRLDKQKAVQGVYEPAHHGDVIAITGKVQSHPARKEVAVRNLKEFLTGLGQASSDSSED